MNELILIVEDEKDMAELIRCNVEKHGYRTIVAENGEQAVTAVRRHEPDLVLLDVMLPELNGWEVCRALRENTKGGAIPIVMLTALSAEEERIRGLALGADDCLSKPISIKELLPRIRNLLDRETKISALESSQREDSFRCLVHEFQNAVNAIGINSRLALYRINSGALHMESLLNDTSLLSLLEKDEEEPPTGPMDIDSLVEGVVETFQDAMKSAGVTITIVNATSAFVLGNAAAVRQVLINLLSNAVKYNREGGRVWIWFSETDDGVDISVKDNGRGIPEDEVSKIFEKVYRARGSEQVKDTGLGLYLVKLLLVKLLAKAMGGAVNVTSEEGTGSTFTVSFKKASGTIQTPQKVA